LVEGMTADQIGPEWLAGSNTLAGSGAHKALAIGGQPAVSRRVRRMTRGSGQI